MTSELRDISTSDDANAIHIDRYVPFFINSISNKLTHGSSRLYSKEFGVGVIEWRVIGFLQVREGASANDICRLLGIDKAAVSRAIKLLEDKELVASVPVNGRQRALSLTGAGHQLHDLILPVALEREKILLSSLSGEEQDALLRLLRKLDTGISLLSDRD